MRWQFAESPNYDVLPLLLHFVVPSPSVDLKHGCLYGCHLYGRLEVTNWGFEQTLEQLTCEHIFAYHDLEQPAYIQSYVTKALVDLFFEFVYDKTNFVGECLTSLNELPRNCLQNIVRLYQELFPKFRLFCVP